MNRSQEISSMIEDIKKEGIRQNLFQELSRRLWNIKKESETAGGEAFQKYVESIKKIRDLCDEADRLYIELKDYDSRIKP